MNEARISNFLGISYSSTNRFLKAVESYRRALKLDPNLAEAHLNLGYAYHRLNQAKQAQSKKEEGLFHWVLGLKIRSLNKGLIRSVVASRVNP